MLGDDGHPSVGVRDQKAKAAPQDFNSRKPHGHVLRAENDSAAVRHNLTMSQNLQDNFLLATLTKTIRVQREKPPTFLTALALGHRPLIM